MSFLLGKESPKKEKDGLDALSGFLSFLLTPLILLLPCDHVDKHKSMKKRYEFMAFVSNMLINTYSKE